VQADEVQSSQDVKALVEEARTVPQQPGAAGGAGPDGMHE